MSESNYEKLFGTAERAAETLANVEHQLAEYGYVKVVRCMNCVFYQPDMYKHFTCECLQRWATPDDFCAWAKRKERIEQ